MSGKEFDLKKLFLVLCTIFILYLSGCLNPFAPKLEETPDLQFLITEQKSPEDVLKNFKLAYLFRDSVLYNDVLDNSFMFYYYDTNIDAAGIQGHWGRDTDLKTTGRLFRTFDMINLIWESSVYVDTLDVNKKADIDSIEVIKRFSLKLTQTTDGLDFDIWGKAYFFFIRNPMDQKWRIRRWTDESFY